MILPFAGMVPRLARGVFVAPSATVIGDARLSARASIWFGAVLRADLETIWIGEGSNLQDNVVVHADPGFPVTVGDGVTVGHLVVIHGCTVEEGSLIGMGSVLMNGSRVGRGAILGAGSLLPEGKEIPPGMLALGRPARVIRAVTEAERQKSAASAEHYSARAQAYLRDLPEA